MLILIPYFMCNGFFFSFLHLVIDLLVTQSELYTLKHLEIPVFS